MTPSERARDEWRSGEPERALALLRDSGAQAAGELPTLAAEIARVCSAVDRTLGDFPDLVGTQHAAPERLRALQTNVAPWLGSEAASAAGAARQTLRCLGDADRITAHVCAELPTGPAGLAALYARPDWVLVERGRDGSDLWWRGQLQRMPAGHHPQPTLASALRHACVARLLAAAPRVRGWIPAVLRRQLKRPLAPLLRRLGLRADQNSQRAPSIT